MEVISVLQVQPVLLFFGRFSKYEDDAYVTSQLAVKQAYLTVFCQIENW